MHSRNRSLNTRTLAHCEYATSDAVPASSDLLACGGTDLSLVGTTSPILLTGSNESREKCCNQGCVARASTVHHLRMRCAAPKWSAHRQGWPVRPMRKSMVPRFSMRLTNGCKLLWRCHKAILVVSPPWLHGATVCLKALLWSGSANCREGATQRLPFCPRLSCVRRQSLCCRPKRRYTFS